MKKILLALLCASQYVLKDSGKISWYAEINVDNPQKPAQSAKIIAKKIYDDLNKAALLKNQ